MKKEKHRDYFFESEKKIFKEIKEKSINEFLQHLPTFEWALSNAIVMSPIGVPVDKVRNLSLKEIKQYLLCMEALYNNG